MNRSELIQKIKEKRSFLCVGLDPDLGKIPSHLHDTEDPIFEFNKAIIDSTLDYAVAYKPNSAFYECLGLEGWRAFEKTVQYIGKNHFIIADAKRGDIGNTARKYAEAFLQNLPCDAITVAPYMGEDSVSPFLEFENKWAILLALTSNQGATDFQMQSLQSNSEHLYQRVIRESQDWGTPENLMYVIGATRPEYLKEIRELAPDHFFLVPGVGAQGGSLEDVARYGMNKDIGLLVNSSRGIIYAGSGHDFAEKAGMAAAELANKMKSYF